MQGKIFEDRMTAIENYFHSHPSPFVEVVSHEVCEGKVQLLFIYLIHSGVQHLKQRLKEVEANGGEGLMLRAPRSFYEPYR